MKSSVYKNVKAESFESATNTEMEAQEEFIDNMVAEKKSEERSKTTNVRNKKNNSTKDISISLRLNPEEKKEWAEFSRKIDFPLAMAIRKAMRYYIQQYEKGKLDI